MERNKKSFLALSLILLMFLSLSFVVVSANQSLNDDRVEPQTLGGRVDTGSERSDSGSDYSVWSVGRDPDGKWTISSNKEGGIHEPVTSPAWLVSTINFLDWGYTWADFIISLAIFVMIFGIMYDATTFVSVTNTKWVKFLIAFGVAVIATIFGMSNFLATLVLGLVGGSAILGLLLFVGMAILAFIGGSWARGKMRKAQFKEKMQNAEEGFARSRLAAAEETKKAIAIEKANKED